MGNVRTLAIQASLDNDWEIAIDLNNQILEENPLDVATLNRLARAYTELGQKESAKTIYQKVLSIDQYNPIALKNLRLLPDKNSKGEIKLSREDFVEQSGITKTVQLVKTASKNVLLSLSCKQSLNLYVRSRLMAVSTEENIYIGCLPDDLSQKIAKHVKNGYKYTVCLKTASDNVATIFIRELKRPGRASAGPTFSRSVPLT